MQELGGLRQVVPIALAETRGDVTVTLISLEVYDQGSILTLALRSERGFPLAEFRGPRGPEPQLEVADPERHHDVNIQEASGGQRDWRFRYQLSSMVCQRAQKLRVHIPQITLQLIRGPAQSTERLPGPWEFMVDIPPYERPIA